MLLKVLQEASPEEGSCGGHRRHRLASNAEVRQLLAGLHREWS